MSFIFEEPPSAEVEDLLETIEPYRPANPLKVFHADDKQGALDEALQMVPEAAAHFLGGSAGLGLQAADIDVFMMVPDLNALSIRLQAVGFKTPGFENYKDSNFIPFRKGDLNIVAMDDQHDFDQTRLAYKVCQYLVSEGIIPTKEQRKMIHRILRDEPVQFVTP